LKGLGTAQTKEKGFETASRKPGYPYGDWH